MKKNINQPNKSSSKGQVPVFKACIKEHSRDKVFRRKSVLYNDQIDDSSYLSSVPASHSRQTYDATDMTYQIVNALVQQLCRLTALVAVESLDFDLTLSVALKHSSILKEAVSTLVDVANGIDQDTQKVYMSLSGIEDLINYIPNCEFPSDLEHVLEQVHIWLSGNELITIGQAASSVFGVDNELTKEMLIGMINKEGIQGYKITEETMPNDKTRVFRKDIEALK